jgi:hypothetical protein
MVLVLVVDGAQRMILQIQEGSVQRRKVMMTIEEYDEHSPLQEILRPSTLLTPRFFSVCNRLSALTLFLSFRKVILGMSSSVLILQNPIEKTIDKVSN